MVDSQQNSQQQLDSQQHELQIIDAQQQEGAAQKISVEQQEGVQKDNMISAAEAFQKLKDSDVKRYNYSSFKDNKFLGEGAFADVFSATFENKQYALKHIKNKDLDDEMFKTVTQTDVEFITNIVPENKRTQTFSSLFSDTKLIHELWQIFLKSTNRGNEFRQISKMIKDSKTWYQKASDNGHKDAEKQLAQLSSKTKGIGLTSFFKAKENNIQSDGNNH
ncbi:26163_t:CDS:2 [Gigaspora margarita]|uniref:26163_t:CDS:1 n=1 Tax=Gigaspora margarita TaxID=4874 RepID=A0ABN7UP16_GIGMA|nr:26163_t:CDS:2 [Gigaspora margarita]